MTYWNPTTDKTQNPSLLMTLLYGLLVKVYNLQQNFSVRTYENWLNGVQIENKTQSWKKPRSSYSPGPLSPETQNPFSKLYGKDSNLSSSEISRNHFQLQIHLPKTLRGNPGALQHQVSPNQTFSQQKMETQPRPPYYKSINNVSEYGSLSTITTLDTIISKRQRLQNKFIRLALRLPKYISVKLLHDSSGLPYVKDRLLSYATRTLERTFKNPLVDESITFNRVNPA